MLSLLAMIPAGVLGVVTSQPTTAPASWVGKLLSDPNAVAHIVLIISIVAAAGLALGAIRIWGISLGIGGVLFSGLIVGHLFHAQYGYEAVNEHVLEFVREFGLILFVYTIGMQVGPGFLASLRKQGLPLNIMAASIVLLGVGVTLVLHKVVGIPLPTAVGLLSGAVTNTPSLAAATDTLKGVAPTSVGQAAVGYALAYPFGIMGIILTMVMIRFAFKVSLPKEQEAIVAQLAQNRIPLINLNIEVKNPNLNGLQLKRIPAIRECGVVVSRILQNSAIQVAHPTTVVKLGDVLHAVGQKEGLEQFRLVVGEESRTDLRKLPTDITYRKMIVTRSHALGKTVEELNLLDRFGVTVTRLGRGDVQMSPASGARLQFGDTLWVVGDAESLKEVADELGDSTKRLNHPHVIPIFLGIALGVILGSWAVPLGLPAPVKLGLAGGPLVVAIILARIANIGPLVWYMPASANFMVRELGIVLFLSCVGLASGDKFVAALTSGEGFRWMGYAALITAVPLVIVGLIGRAVFKMNYMTLCGLLAGSMTDPPALAFAGAVTGSDAPSVSYATVYPLTMLLRVLTAQAMVLLLS